MKHGVVVMTLPMIIIWFWVFVCGFPRVSPKRLQWKQVDRDWYIRINRKWKPIKKCTYVVRTGLQLRVHMDGAAAVRKTAMTANLGNKKGTKVPFFSGATAAHGGGAILFLRSKSFSQPPSGTRMFSMCSIFAVIAASAAPVPHWYRTTTTLSLHRYRTDAAPLPHCHCTAWSHF